MNDHDIWARDFVQNTSPIGIASGLIALSDELKKAFASVRSLEDSQRIQQGDDSARLEALAHAASESDWKTPQILTELAKRVSALKPSP